MTKILLSAFLLAVFFIAPSLAICYDHSYDYEDARAYSEICLEKSFTGAEFTDGDFVEFSCNSGSHLYYQHGSYPSCDDTGCEGTQTSNPFKYYLPPFDTVTPFFRCYNLDVSPSGYYAYCYQGAFVSNLHYGSLPEESPPTDLPEVIDDSLSDLNLFQSILQFIRDFLRSLGLGSIGSGTAQGGGGGGP